MTDVGGINTDNEEIGVGPTVALAITAVLFRLFADDVSAVTEACAVLMGVDIAEVNVRVVPIIVAVTLNTDAGAVVWGDITVDVKTAVVPADVTVSVATAGLVVICGDAADVKMVVVPANTVVTATEVADV